MSNWALNDAERLKGGFPSDTENTLRIGYPIAQKFDMRIGSTDARAMHK